MRDWRGYWRDRETGDSADLATELREVGKTVMGEPISAMQLDAIVSSLYEALDLDKKDEVVDLGCGNGLITARLAQTVCRIRGFDVSNSLVAAARARYGRAGVRFEIADICDLDFSTDVLRDVRKVYLYEVAQHLTTKEFETLLTNAFHCGGVNRLFSGSMPDAARLEIFYNTPERIALYRRNLALKKEQIGHWWKISEIKGIAERLGLQMELREQDPILHTAHYRFDVLFHG